MENDNTNSDTVAAKSNNRQMGPVAENSSGNTSENTTSPTAPTNSDGTQMQPPEMNCDSSSEECTMPEPPEGFDGQMPTEMQGGFGGRGELTTQNVASSSNAWHPAFYLAVGGGSVILGILISYAIFSRFFHLKPGQTFSKLAKFIWFIVVALVIAVGICVLGYFIPVWTQS